ncbi:bifunctional riboflavin kinase/FAD synthetase [Demequina sp. SYSU T00039]|uniref:Riboflavin biosynthesis protein n=1 Tax=Demequina lignilytica TaxID=3051663 RepID=A0AAW7M8G6_9MICO|nr:MULTISPECIES: bifunctional riboflavin kinase/FAD synthetase [unclassified Demequina]MDN4477173.1 bifunctional riboflavin kinase/FAD synthetase [Demequina sp. SYSU T00039-1]MDN4487346.1 bifunctional riboflavin kinase/FAD synthetase [Demequina sp. SYSU T00039]MDN4491099.1 bifunctional riboflavin kinase/FAD synthetase [Demequina sp. SYSU T00068]
MHVWRSLAEIPDLGPAVVTLGNFDGVHRGHQAVLGAMVADARARGQVALAMTFDPHPKAVHDPAHPPELLTGIDDRLERLAAIGLDGVLVVRYTLDFARQTPEEFVRDYLVRGMRASCVVVGRDTRFGRGNAGDVETMRELGDRLGFDVDIIDDACAVSESGRRWSSTWVRELVEEGDLRGAADVLGREHRVRGVVIHGDKLGRTIGFPTANLDHTAGMIPRHGVYAAWLTVIDPGDNARAAAIAQERLPAAVSLGMNYTVGGTDLRIEAYVIDAEGLDLYGAEVALDLVEWRRPMLDFGSVEALVVGLEEDVDWCREALEIRP